MKKTYGLTLAIREHLSSGKPISRLEAMILYGVSNLPMTINTLRREGWEIKAKKIPYAKALVRLNQSVEVKVPTNLPIREIVLTEYQLIK